MMATSTHDGSLYTNGKRAREEMAATSHDHYESKRLCDWFAYILLNGLDDDDDGKLKEDEQGVDSDRLLQMMKSLQDEIVVADPTEQPIAVQSHEKNHILTINPPSSFAHVQDELSLSHGSYLSYDRNMLTQESKVLGIPGIPVECRITSMKKGPSSSEKQRLIKKNM